ncbi:hypothetical protein CYMTET_10596 [Cymbomonas tetramitiformis]|uniref:Uncharacterized protein n=1 Tax=Cymbomonas tetramitiformis TaxID=36881 RepID=A0AAE0GNY0_9CHLO|nr:hypothetical protein CYMTET_10596 [Cymbomonas tetramitiformis]
MDSAADYFNKTTTHNTLALRADDVARSFETELDSSDDELPCGSAADMQADAVCEVDGTAPTNTVQSMAFECPEGFAVVEKPNTFLSGAVTFRTLFILMLWKGEGWQVGKINKYAPERMRHNHDILWAEGIRGSMLKLEHYADFDSLELQPVGTWAYVRAVPK